MYAPNILKIAGQVKGFEVAEVLDTEVPKVPKV